MIPPKSEASNSLETPAPCQSAKDLNAAPTAGKAVILVDVGPSVLPLTRREIALVGIVMIALVLWVAGGHLSPPRRSPALMHESNPERNSLFCANSSGTRRGCDADQAASSAQS